MKLTGAFKNEGKWCIYAIKNTINGKVYIGQTFYLNSRIKSHCSRSKNKIYMEPIYCAIRKYGIDNFDLQILHNDIKTVEEAHKLEIQYISEYKSRVPNGYNITIGGEGNFGHKHTAEWKRLASERMKGVKFMLGIKHTELWKREASKRLLGNKFAFGHKHTTEWKEKHTKRMVNNNPNKKFTEEEGRQIYMEYLNTDKSQREIAAQFACSQNTIMRLVKKYGIPEYKLKQMKEKHVTDLMSNNQNKKISDEKREMIYQRYITMENKSQRKVGLEFGCSQCTVKNIIKTYID